MPTGSPATTSTCCVDFLVRLETDPTVWAGVQEVPAVTTGLGGLLDRYERDVAVTSVMTSFVTGGVTALAVLVLALTALLGAQRRDREVRLLRARGASRAQVLGLVAVATSVLAVPLAAVAAAAVVLLVPGDTSRSAWVEVALVVVLPPLVAVVATARRVRAIDEVPEETTRTVRAARRVVLEVAVVLLAVLAVTTVRSRGAVIAAGRTDWYAAVTPVLVALAAAVVALRVMPWPVSRLAGVAERGRGLVAFVGLTRAARTGAGDGRAARGPRRRRDPRHPHGDAHRHACPTSASSRRCARSAPTRGSTPPGSTPRTSPRSRPARASRPRSRRTWMPGPPSAPTDARPRWSWSRSTRSATRSCSRAPRSPSPRRARRATDGCPWC